MQVVSSINLFEVSEFFSHEINDREFRCGRRSMYGTNAGDGEGFKVSNAIRCVLHQAV